MSPDSEQPNPLIAGYHSSVAYAYPENHARAIIKTVAYHRKDFDLEVIWFPAHTPSDAASSLAADHQKPTASLGELDKLPLELIINICWQLDIESLFRFRQVNARGQQIVNTLHEYRVIIKYALNVFLALLRTRKTPSVTLEEFYSLLCTQECSVCGKYGNLVYLPTWVRCCSSCLHSNSPATNTTSLGSVKRLLSLSQDALQNFPRFKTLPGIYGTTESSYKHRIICVPTQHVIAAYEKGYNEKPILSCFSPPHQKYALDFKACCVLPVYNPQNRQVEYGVSCAGCEVFLQDVVSRLHQKWAFVARDMVYSHSEYLEHFAWCEQAQLLWEESAHGMREPEGLPMSCKRGGFFERCSSC
ncbi:cyclin-like F-box [Karstenula rhodostoma CBS 690.94]|uniref:Cyclin-like F-box n=1 Tax=Karstenula rhodostoma CBS 690.94 TaxID=1392251 RepID=A0A9P4PW63_9PLEO|nr:cyclin-like F-box [Karstenula rhodostoma CBS 690.94]